MGLILEHLWDNDRSRLVLLDKDCTWERRRDIHCQRVSPWWGLQTSIGHDSLPKSRYQCCCIGRSKSWSRDLLGILWFWSWQCRRTRFLAMHLNRRTFDSRSYSSRGIRWTWIDLCRYSVSFQFFSYSGKNWGRQRYFHQILRYKCFRRHEFVRIRVLVEESRLWWLRRFSPWMYRE